MSIQWGQLGDGTVALVLWVLTLPLVGAAIASCGHTRPRFVRAAIRWLHALHLGVTGILLFVVVREHASLAQSGSALLIHSGRPELAQSIAAGFTIEMGGRHFAQLSQAFLIDLRIALITTLWSLLFCWVSWRRPDSDAPARALGDAVRLAALLAVTCAANSLGVFVVLLALTLVTVADPERGVRRRVAGLFASDAFFLAGVACLVAVTGAADILVIAASMESAEVAFGLGCGLVCAAVILRVVVAPDWPACAAGLVVGARYLEIVIAGSTGALVVVLTTAAAVVVGLGLSAMPQRLDRTESGAAGDRDVVETVFGAASLLTHVASMFARLVQNGSLLRYVALSILGVALLAWFYASVV